MSILKASDVTDEIIQELVTHCVNGLCTDGAHHKQYDLQQILKILDPSDSIACEREETGEYCPWDEGIA